LFLHLVIYYKVFEQGSQMKNLGNSEKPIRILGGRATLSTTFFRFLTNLLKIKA
jgi:hypothetical protein